MDFYKYLQSLRNIMRKDKSCNGDAARIEQLSWLFLLKIFDDVEKENELLDSKYYPVIKKEFQWRNWATNEEGITGDKLINFINSQLFPHLKDLKSKDKTSNSDIIRNCFVDISNFMSNGTLLRQLINKMNELNFTSSKDFHLFGTVYEEFLRLLQSAGDAGEFYTPRPLTKFMADKIDPKVNEITLDPACGTGGFITACIDHIRKKIRTVKETKEIEKNVRGIEAKSLPYVLGVTNMFLHKLNNPKNIIRGNILEKPLRDYGESEKVNIIITNPPFGGDEIDGIELNVSSDVRTKETAKLFLTYINELLKKNGRAAIILPDGTLSDNDSSDLNIKKKLLESTNLHTIIKLPDSVFQPYAGVSTNMIFFDKIKNNTKGIWYYELKLPKNYKAFSKTKPLLDEHLEDLNRWWLNKKKTDNSWYLSINDIKKRNYNLDSKNPIPLINFDLSNATSKIYNEKLNLINELKNLSYKKSFKINEDLDRIENLFDIKEGSIQSSKSNNNGKYDFITASSEWKKHDVYSHDCEAIILAAKAGGSLGRTHYVNGKFVASGLCYILTPKKNKKILLKFYHQYFNFIKKDFVYRTKTGTSKKTLDLKKIKSYLVLYPDKKFQENIVNEIETFEKIKELTSAFQNDLDDQKIETVKRLFSKSIINKIWSEL